QEEARAVVAPLGSELVSRVLITGAAGMLGRKLAARLADVDEVLLHDIVEPAPLPRAPYKARSIASDVSAPGEAEKLLAARAPLTSYGTQKAIDELLLADYSRRGFFDGIGIRLPTICVRPGKPNRAASGFFSGIIREPLAGQEAVLPVPKSVRHWFASPRAGVGFLLHAARLDTAQLGARRSLSMPGISATVGEQIEALRKVGGEKAV